MNDNYSWREVTPELYGAIRRECMADLMPFGTITDMSGYYSDGHPHIMTEWGFRDADYPLIKSEERRGEAHYFIAIVKEADHEA